MLYIFIKLRNLLRACGFDIIRSSQAQIGIDYIVDIQKFLKNVNTPVIFDVGANMGQSVKRFKKGFPTSVIHSFEPSPIIFKKLQSNCKMFNGVETWNMGIGSENASLEFYENECSEMSSFLHPSRDAWGSIFQTTKVPVYSLDCFSQKNNIEIIHVLKCDTQGYEFEVFKGAERLMNLNKIALIYFEFTFSDMYKGLPRFDEVFKWLQERNFDFVSFYSPHYQSDLIGWCDLLFINRNFKIKHYNSK